MTNSSNNKSREEILAAVRSIQPRTAVVSQPYQPSDVLFNPEDLLADFTSEIETVAGKCFHFLDSEELYSAIVAMVHERGWENLVTADAEIAKRLSDKGLQVYGVEEDLTKMQVAVTSCEALVARTGSVLMSSRRELGRQLYAFAPVHLVIATADQLVAFPEDALRMVQERYDDQLPAALSFVTGPSRTADIEKTLVLGAHGPKELFIFVLKS